MDRAQRPPAEDRTPTPIEVWLAQRPLVTAVAFGFFLWVLLLILAQALWILILILAAAILATVMMPPVRLIRKLRLPPGGWRIPKWIAVLILYLAVLLFLVYVGYRAAETLIQEMSSLAASLPGLLQGLPGDIDQFEQSAGLTGVLPPGKEILIRAQALATSSFASLGQLEIVIGGTLGFFFGLFFVLVLALFLVQESQPILGFWVHLYPPARRDRVHQVTADVGNRVAHWLLGQLTVATLSGILAGLGIWALGLPYPVLFGAGTALLDLAPMVGPSLMGVPAALVGLSHSPITAALAVLLFYGISFLDGHVFSPYITGRFVQLPMSLILCVVPLGAVLYGALGALVAIPVAAALVVVANEVLLPWLRRREGVPGEQGGEAEPEHRDRAA